MLSNLAPLCVCGKWRTCKHALRVRVWPLVVRHALRARPIMDTSKLTLPNLEVNRSQVGTSNRFHCLQLRGALSHSKFKSFKYELREGSIRRLQKETQILNQICMFKARAWPHVVHRLLRARSCTHILEEKWCHVLASTTTSPPPP